MKKSIHKKILNQAGAGLVMAIISVTVLGAAGYYTLAYIDEMDKNRSNLDLNLKAKLVAEDAVEATKYLLFYERLVAFKYPQIIPSDWRSFNDSMSNMSDWIKACGVMDNIAETDEDMPDFKLKGTNSDKWSVFCPSDLRDFRVSSDILEVQYQKLAAMENSGIEDVRDSGLPGTENNTGVFKIGPFKYYTHEEYAPSGFDSNKTWFNFGLDPVTRKRIKNIDVWVYVYTQSSGFSTVDSERYIKIESTVKYGMDVTGTGDLTVNHMDAFMMRASSMKEFAVFFAYPDDGKSLKESFKIDKESTIHGKVYFRNNLKFTNFKTEFENLPNFKDLVVFGGKPEEIDENLPPPTLENIKDLGKKFRRGFVFGMSDYFIFDSDTVSNKTGGLYASAKLTESEGDFDPYLSKTSYCDDADPDTDYVTVTIEDNKSSCSQADVGRWGGPFVPLKGGGIKKVEINNEHAFLMVASKKFDIKKDNSSLYGVMLGGSFTGGKKVDIYALPNIKPGLPGITNGYSSMVKNANSTFDLIGVPFLNMPLIIKGK